MLSALNDGGVRSKTLLTRLADQPKSPAIIGVAEVLCEQGHYSEAITRLRSVAEIYGDTYRFNLVLARAFRDAGEIELAKQHYEKACQIAPQNEVAIRELIALTAFPQSIPKPAPQVAKQEDVKQQGVQAASPPTQEMPELEIPTMFKLDRDKLSKVLGGVIGSAEKSGAPQAEIQKPDTSVPSASPSVVEAFRKTDNLLEQEPDIDALAREMMGNAFLPNEPINAVQNDLSEKSSVQSPAPQPKIAAPSQSHMESEADIDAIAQQMLGIGGTNVFRVLGWQAGVFVTLFDMFKGIASVTLIVGYFTENPIDALPNVPFIVYQLIAGVAAMLGHIYTVFAGFKGGKGVSTGAGVVIGIAPITMAFVVGIFLSRFF